MIGPGFAAGAFVLDFVIIVGVLAAPLVSIGVLIGWFLWA